MTRLAPLILLGLLAAGCATPPTVPAGTLPDTYTWSANISYGAGLWRGELSKRFDNPVIIDVHGGTDSRTGRWALFPDGKTVLDADTVAWVMKQLYPGRPVVFVSCNEDAKKLHIPGCWYATDFVVSVPGLPWLGVSEADEFIEGKP